MSPSLRAIGIICLVLAATAIPGFAQTLRPLTVTERVPEDLESLDREVKSANGQSTGSRLLDALSKPVVGGVSLRDAVLDPTKQEVKDQAALLPTITASVVRAMRDEGGPVQRRLSLLSEDFDLVSAAAKDGNVVAQQALIAAVALDLVTSSKLLDSLFKLDRGVALSVQSDLREIRRLLSAYTGNELIGALLAQGSIRGAIAGSGEESGAGTGSVGFSAARKGWTLTGLVTVASSVDTIRDGFGSFLLTPATGKGSLSTFLVDFYTPSFGQIFPNLPKPDFWPALHTYLAGANSTWEAGIVRSPGADTTIERQSAGVLGVGLLANWRILRGRLLNTPVQVNVETGFSKRWLRGNIFADTTFIRGALRYPGDDVPASWGAWETGFQMTVGAVTAGVQYYWINGKNNERFVSGLTSGQLVIALGVAGEVVSGVLGK
jgi:hypothetical protein